MHVRSSSVKVLTYSVVWGMSLFYSLPLFANASVDAQKVPLRPVPDPLSAEVIAQLLIGLVVVIFLIFFCAFLFKRFGGISYQGSQMKVVTGLTLGSKERLLLVQVGEQKQVLLSVAANGIQLLAEFDSPVVESSGELSPFANRLRDAMNKGRQ